MARPSKLTDKQWAEVEKRVPPLGKESMRSVAKELGISEGVIRKRVKTQTKPVIELANQIASVERKFERLPLSTQVKVRTIADRLKGVSEHLSVAAENGARTARILSGMAADEAEELSERKERPAPDEMRNVAAMIRVANDASTIGLNLMAANKEAFREEESEVLPVKVVIQVEDASQPEPQAQ